MFVGKHIYDSRIVRNHYSIDDVIEQIKRGMDAKAKLRITPNMTVLEYPDRRDDGYGNKVRDQVVLECSTKYPRPELFSAIPKGDQNKPPYPPSGQKGLPHQQPRDLQRIHLGNFFRVQRRIRYPPFCRTTIRLHLRGESFNTHPYNCRTEVSLSVGYCASLA